MKKYLFAVVGLVFATGLHAAQFDDVTQPPVPDTIVVPATAEGFLLGHGVGTQNYVCVPSGSGFAWSLFTPEATLFSDEGRQLITHFFSPNPVEDRLVRATWQDSQDSSIFWGKVTGTSIDERFVTRGAIAWLRLEFAGAQAGTTGGGKLTKTAFIQRVNTVGGAAPSTGCSATTDVGNKAFVPYSADYIFYKNRTSGTH